jgi:hypothetical protein
MNIKQLSKFFGEPQVVESNCKISVNQSNGKGLKIKLFYDLLCSDCKDSHEALQEVLDTTVPNQNTKFGDLLQIDIVPYALPYFQHSFSLASALASLRE